MDDFEGRIKTQNIITCLTLENEPKCFDYNLPSLVNCLKCELKYTFPQDQDEYLAHLFLIHRLVIADVEDIADLRGYLLYWIQEFKEKELEHYCTTMLLDQLPNGTPSKNEKYFLLSDVLPKDLEIRKSLHIQRLERVLAQHQLELTDRSFCRECMHCRDVIKGLRSDFLEHLYNKHFVQLGKSDNLVYIDELLNVVQNKLENLICLYCEKIFKDRSTLKEHMRKKGHKRINPDIKLYDKYFLVNYKIEKPKRCKNFHQKHQGIDDSKNKKHFIKVNVDSTPNKSGNKNRINLSDDDDSDWSDWEEDNRPITCLFCNYKHNDFGNIKLHMLEEHDINFDQYTCSLNFYEKIKIVNFVRRQFHILQCIKCNERFDNKEVLQQHLKINNHYTIGEKKQWDKAEFFFPTYEDDEMLCNLDDENCDLDKPPVFIYSEDTKSDANEEAEKLSLENFALTVSKLF